jgi:prepilin-type N-terminal cleavage/methylation domain-containing protein
VRRRSSSAGFSLLELLVVVAVIGVVSAIAVPMIGKTAANYRVAGAARSLSNALAVTKIRAASTFTRTRLYVDLSTNTHHLEILDRSVDPDHWAPEGGTTYMPYSVEFGFSPVSEPPLNTQPSIAQSVKCTEDDGTEINNTACITFNSRGVPVDTTGAPVSSSALYLTDGSEIYGVTVAATGMIRLWRTYPLATPDWVLQ